MVSIIIPVYNVSDYILDCLASVAAQNYTSIEAIVVDDCGTDGSLEVVERFIKDYDGSIDFKIIHHEHNRGLSVARNSGILASNGEYLFFLDGDDVISEECIEKLVVSIEQEEDIEMSIGNVVVKGIEGGWTVPLMPEGVYDTDLFQYYFDKQYYEPVWNKLVRRSFIYEHSLFFKEGLLHEDSLWSFQVACHLKKMATIDAVTYSYITRPGSICTRHDRVLKESNCARLSAFQAEYALAHRKNDKVVFLYVERQRIGFFKRALNSGDDNLISYEYNLIRKTPYWSPFSILFLGGSVGMILRSFHKILPSQLGLWYYKLSVSRGANLS